MADGSNVPGARSRLVNADGTPSPVWFRFFQQIYRALGAGADFSVDNVMLKSNDLSDVESVPQARLNLGAGTTGDALFQAATPAAARAVIDAPRLTGGNTFSGTQVLTDFLPQYMLYANDAAGIGPICLLYRSRTVGGVNDLLGTIQFYGNNSAGAPELFAAITALSPDPTDGSEDGAVAIGTMVGGAQATCATFGAGVVVGPATGGDKGPGTVNISGDLYKNNTAYTNPDYVFEAEYGVDTERARLYPGRLSLDALAGYVRDKHHLPGLPQAKRGAFERADWLLEKVEELALYALDLHERVKVLEAERGRSPGR